MDKTKVKVALIKGFFGVIVVLISSLVTVYVTHKDGENGDTGIKINASGGGTVTAIGDGGVQQNEYHQNNEYNNFYTEKSWSDYSVNDLLILAEEALNSGNDEKAYEIYLTDKICDNEIALCNLGYMYLNGCYVEQNFEKAKEYYGRVETPNGLKGLLAVAIQERNEDDILRLMAELANENNTDFWNYMSLCQYGKTIDEVGKENIVFDESIIDNFYQFLFPFLYR